jgi:hypothetical protein
MSVQHQASPHDIAGLGIAFSIAGFYFMLGAAGYLPMPETGGPWFIVFCTGAAFLVAGLTCMTRAGRVEQHREMSASTLRQAPHRVVVVAAAGAWTIVGVWAAIASGHHLLEFSGLHADMQTAGETIGRVVFALGTTVALIYAIALSVGTVRRIFERSGAGARPMEDANRE